MHMGISYMPTYQRKAFALLGIIVRISTPLNSVQESKRLGGRALYYWPNACIISYHPTLKQWGMHATVAHHRPAEASALSVVGYTGDITSGVAWVKIIWRYGVSLSHRDRWKPKLYCSQVGMVGHAMCCVTKQRLSSLLVCARAWTHAKCMSRLRMSGGFCVECPNWSWGSKSGYKCAQARSTWPVPVTPIGVVSNSKFSGAGAEFAFVRACSKRLHGRCAYCLALCSFITRKILPREGGLGCFYVGLPTHLL